MYVFYKQTDWSPLRLPDPHHNWCITDNLLPVWLTTIGSHLASCHCFYRDRCTDIINPICHPEDRLQRTYSASCFCLNSNELTLKSCAPKRHEFCECFWPFLICSHHYKPKHSVEKWWNMLIGRKEKSTAVKSWFKNSIQKGVSCCKILMPCRINTILKCGESWFS